MNVLPGRSKATPILAWVRVDFGVLLRALFVPLFVLTVTEHGTVPRCVFVLVEVVWDTPLVWMLRVIVE